jgi:hypothetical protein
MTTFSFSEWWSAITPDWTPHREQRRYLAAVDAGQPESFLHWAKKTAKSSTAANRALHYLVAEGRDPEDRLGAIASFDEEQSQIIFAIAAQIVERSPWLRERVRVLRNEMVFEEECTEPRTGGRFTRVHRLRALARDTRGLHGEPWGFIVRDEYWSEPNHEMTEALIPSPARPHTELLYLSYSTLASMRKPGVPFHDAMTRVEQGDPSLFYSYIGGAGDDASWKVCPWIRQEWVEQQRKIFSASPSRFRRVVLNEQVIGGDGDTLLTVAEVQAAIDPSLPAVPVPNRAERYIGGLDLAVSNDHACLLIGHLDGRGRFVVDVCRVWKPGEQAISFTAIVESVLAWHRQLPLAALHVDQWNAKLLVELLQRASVPARLVGVEQSKLNEIISTMKTTFARRAIRIAPTQTYLLAQLEALRVLETRTPRRDLLKFAPSGTGMDASQHDDAAVSLGLCLTDKSLVDRIGRDQMPPITHCAAADYVGVSYLQIDCPLIDPTSARPGCKRCAPWVAASERQAAEVKETGVWRPIHAIAAAEWQPCPFITQWRFQRVAINL